VEQKGGPGVVERERPRKPTGTGSLSASVASPLGRPGRPRSYLSAFSDGVRAPRVIKLYDQFGFDAVDGGTLDDSWRFAAGQPAFVVRQDASELTANMATASRHI
jgi:8-hydroxy-5-deazaflavin:NADPH oxidoreductase